MIAIPATSVTIFGPPAGWEVLPVCVSTSAGSRHFGKCIYIYIWFIRVCRCHGLREQEQLHRAQKEPQTAAAAAVTALVSSRDRGPPARRTNATTTP